MTINAIDNGCRPFSIFEKLLEGAQMFGRQKTTQQSHFLDCWFELGNCFQEFKQPVCWPLLMVDDWHGSMYYLQLEYDKDPGCRADSLIADLQCFYRRESGT